MKAKQILDQLPALVYRLDALGRISYINDEVRNYGYEPAELIGRDILELVHPDDRTLISHNLHERRTGNRATRNLHARFITGDNTTRVLQVYSKSEIESEGDEITSVHVNLFTMGLYNKKSFLGSYGIAWDVTESVASEELLEKMLEDSPISMLVYDSEGYIQHANSSARSKLALPDISKKTHVTDLIEEDEIEPTWRRITQMLAGVESDPRAFQIRALDGRKLLFEIRARPLILQGRKCVLLTMIDVGEHKEYNQRLVESEARYREIFEHANDAVFLMRGNRFIDCNLKTLKIFGIEKSDEIIGMTPLDFSPPKQADGEDSYTAAMRYINAALEGEPQRFSWVHTHGDGTVFPAEVVLSRIQVRGEDLLLAIVRDNSRIEQRFRLEELVSRIAIEFISLPLNDSAPWRKTIESAFSEVAALLQADCIVLYTVDEKENLLSPEYTYYNPEYDPPSIFESDLPIPLVQEAVAEAGAKDGINVLFENDEVNDTRFSEWLKLLDVRSAVNVRLRIRETWIGTFSIAWKQARELDPEELRTIKFLASAFTSLLERRRVSEKENLLTQQLYQAQKMEEVGKLSSGVAHDFNNLLTVILGNTELLRRIIAENEEAYDQKLELLENLSNAADVAVNLTRQLLLFSRTAVAHTEVLQLNDIVQSIQKMISRITPSNILKEVQLADSLPPIAADPTHVQQIILNLSVNAVDAMSNGGTLSLATDLRRLDGEVSCRLCGRPLFGTFATLKIADMGTGMTPEVLNKIFEPFFTTKDQGKGTGLGLATVANIVSEYSGGHMTVNSELGRGTEFEIFFPVDKSLQRSASSRVEPSADEKALMEGTVVLVEDNQHLLTLLTRVLESAGLQVKAFERATQAVNWLATHKGAVSLIVTDQIMPGMTGLELIQEVRASQPELPVLMISGYASESDFDRRLDELAVPFMPKPFSTTDFLSAVQNLLN